MRPFLISVVFLAGMGLSDSNAFEARTAVSAQLSQRETQRYERLKQMPSVVGAKLVSVDEKMFSRGALPLDFDGKRVEFKVIRSESEAVWKGRSGESSDRFVIRNIDGRYSGHLLVKGRPYVLTPVKRDVSVLYEVDTDFECGMAAVEKGSP